MRLERSNIVLATLAVGAMIAAAPAGAQVMQTTRNPIYYGIAAGATIPTGTTGDLHSTGWHVQGLVDWTSTVTPFGFRGDVGYTSLGGKSIAAGTTSITGDDLKMWSGTADAVWMFRQKGTSPTMTPYALGGVGLYHTSDGRSATAVGVTQSIGNHSWNFGLNVGGGVIFHLAGFQTFAELRFHNVFNGTLNDQGNKSSAHFFPLTFGIRFGPY